MSDEPIDELTLSPDVFHDLVFYFKYASSAYTHDICHKPNGNNLIHSLWRQFGSDVTETRGFIAQDDERKELVVALRGSSSIEDALTDVKIALVPFESPGVHAPEDTKVHFGFLSAWNSVASEVLSSIEDLLRLHPDYSIVTTGHSLGGALASLAGMSFKCNLSTRIRIYTYGQPRTGNLAYAEFVNKALGPDVFRVHTNDGVPTMIPTIVGYHHHGVEHWQFIEPPAPLTTRHCHPHGEDLLCSASIPSGGINAAHMSYFGIPVGTPFCE